MNDTTTLVAGVICAAAIVALGLFRHARAVEYLGNRWIEAANVYRDATLCDGDDDDDGEVVPGDEWKRGTR